MAKEFGLGYMLYKAKNDGDGAASQWTLSSDKDSVFLEMANQKKDKDDKGNARFDWENKIRFKLGESDIGEILAVLTGLQKGVGPPVKTDTGFDSKTKHKGLYHSNPRRYIKSHRNCR